MGLGFETTSVEFAFQRLFISFSGDLSQMAKKTSEDFVQKYVENSLNPKKRVIILHIILWLKDEILKNSVLRGLYVSKRQRLQ